MSEQGGDEKKGRMWRVDSSIFLNARKRNTRERFSSPVRSTAKVLAFSLFMGYPLLLVVLGLLFGWVTFWASLGGSFVVLGVAISRLGYSRNFDAWNPSLLRKMGALTIAFIAVAGFYFGLFAIKALMIPIVIMIVLSLFVVGLIYQNRK
jgi:hypothetical protein